MLLRTRLAACLGAAALATGGLVAGGAGSAAAAVSCNGLPITIFAAAGVPTFGGAAPDVILGTGGPDQIAGGGGNDTICALGGDDVMVGNQGNDFMNGGPHIEGDRGNGGLGADACPNTEITISC